MSNSLISTDEHLIFSHVSGARLATIYEELEEGSLLVELGRKLQAVDDYVFELVARLVHIANTDVMSATNHATTKVVVVETASASNGHVYDSFVDALSLCA